MRESEKPAVRGGTAEAGRTGLLSFAVQQANRYSEDRFLCETEIRDAKGGVHSDILACFAVFDGHEGDAAADFASRNLLRGLVSNWPVRRRGCAAAPLVPELIQSAATPSPPAGAADQADSERSPAAWAPAGEARRSGGHRRRLLRSV